MEWLFLNSDQREKLKIAHELMQQVKDEIDVQNREYSLINSSIYSLEDAIDMESIKTE